jgi:two-component system cell cycle sensor histidine kinase/response regulator CckA
METADRLAVGVAHDVNGILTAIHGFASAMRDRLPSDHPAQDDVTEILSAVDRGVRLTRQLLFLGGVRSMQRQPISLSELVCDMRKMLRQIVGANVDLVTVLDAELGEIEADRCQLEQVIMNLCTNARDAMPAGGRLTIQTTVAINDVVGSINGIEHPCAMLAMSDTGCGMTPETQRRIFQPFFTTKSADKGTGLGLATVSEIVSHSGGSIAVSSEVGQGTTFRVFFPFRTQRLRD